MITEKPKNTTSNNNNNKNKNNIRNINDKIKKGDKIKNEGRFQRSCNIQNIHIYRITSFCKIIQKSKLMVKIIITRIFVNVEEQEK